jgi:hypothetical protein
MKTIERILPVLNKNYPLEKRDVVWNTCTALSIQVEMNEENLENMCSTHLVSGFGGHAGQKETIKLAQALGVCGISNPENDAYHGCNILSRANVANLTIDEILDKIQTRLPFQIDFPPFSGNCEQGLQTKYGITSNRHIFYLWVLKRIIELCPDKNSSIIEIGAGFGLLGYYLDKIGYKDYTTIDLARTNACQTYFLARNLPERRLIISGDVDNPFDLKYKDSIKILHSTDFKAVPKNRFSIMVNMDGLTEMGIEQATQYIQHDCSPILFSINHEVNNYRVFDIEQPLKELKYRYPFWLRDGYVEELYVEK